MNRKDEELRYPLVAAIVEGLQQKKGHDIQVVDLSGIEDTICRYFVICTGGSPSQVSALAQSVGEKARELAQAKPLAVDGMQHCQWVAMDYAEVIVHILLPEERGFYDIEHLWADADIEVIPDPDE